MKADQTRHGIVPATVTLAASDHKLVDPLDLQISKCSSASCRHKDVLKKAFLPKSHTPLDRLIKGRSLHETACKPVPRALLVPSCSDLLVARRDGRMEPMEAVGEHKAIWVL
jgi:hypothetical protein